MFPISITMGILKLEQNCDSTLLWLGNVSIRLIQLGAELWIGRDITSGWPFCHKIDSIGIPEIDSNTWTGSELWIGRDITLGWLDLNCSKIPTSPSLSQSLNFTDKGFGGTSSQQRGIKAIYSWDSYSKLNRKTTATTKWNEKLVKCDNQH